jgi:hypothetical protein
MCDFRWAGRSRVGVWQRFATDGSRPNSHNEQHAILLGSGETRPDRPAAARPANRQGTSLCREALAGADPGRNGASLLERLGAYLREKKDRELPKSQYGHAIGYAPKPLG